MAAELHVRLFAGEQKQFAVGKPARLVVHHLQLVQPIGFRNARPGFVMKFGEMRDVHTACLEGLHETRRFESAWHAAGLLLFLLLEKILRVFHVIVAGERQMARQLFVTVAVRVARDGVQRLPSIAACEQIENAKMLLSAGRRVEPRDESPVTCVRLADAEA